MISWSSVWAIVLRHIRMWQRDPNLLLFAFYWPLLDIMIWGFLGSWIQNSQASQFSNYTAIALLGILLWQLVGRGFNIMIMAFVEELWSNNVVNLFSLPLRTMEWMIGVTIVYAIVIMLTSIVSLLVIAMLYDVILWDLLPSFLIFGVPLLFSGVWLGFSCLQILVARGKRGIEFAFVGGWFLLPFSGAYYPVEVLPAWAQMISAWLPMSYVFKGMREYVMYQQDPTWYLLKGYGLGIVYAACAIMLFIYSFNRSKRKGLARLTD